MTGSYENNKTSIYNWKVKNLDRHKEIMLKHSRKQNEWRKASRFFRRIFIDEYVFPRF